MKSYKIQRAISLRRAALAELRLHESRLTPLEAERYQLLLDEAGFPALSISERAAILERARAYVRGQERAEHDKLKGPAQILYELFG